VIFLPLIYVWIIIPLVELVYKPDARNLDAAEEELAKKDRSYDLWLYAVVILQYGALFLYLKGMQSPSPQSPIPNPESTALTPLETLGRLLVMGLLCGSFGINVAHELGHRSNGFERTLSRMLLLSSLYMHFYIEHNKGHHKRVSTPEDPASARYGENVYAFYVRTLVFSWLSAWEIAARDLKKKGLPAFHWRNEMLQYQLIQIAFVAIIWYVFGWRSTLFFLAAAFLGALLLETVNYIEHYGLVRKCRAEGTYERVLPEHSWNSDHVLGRLMLFELSRHSDHHYSASRKYQVLRHHQYAPQMPTGYPGMMILSLIPPLWFRVMHRKMQQLTVSS